MKAEENGGLIRLYMLHDGSAQCQNREPHLAGGALCREQ